MSDNQANKKRKVYHTSSTDATNEAGTVSGHSASRDTSSAPENPPTARIRELRPANFRVGATGRIATPLPHMVNDPYNLNQPGLITRVSAPGGPENPQQSRQAIPRPAPSYGPTRLPPVSYQGSSPYAKRGSKVEIHPDDQSYPGLEQRVSSVERAVDAYVSRRADQALARSSVPGLDASTSKAGENESDDASS